MPRVGLIADVSGALGSSLVARRPVLAEKVVGSALGIAFDGESLNIL